uniref:Uncharacterized protein n=1 Tax=Acrobeloides nanus TaxID=290746 RepID=A0A914D5V6_9BILA
MQGGTELFAIASDDVALAAHRTTTSSPISTSDQSSSAPAVHASPGYFDAPAKQDLYEDITLTSQYDSYLTTPKLVHESDLQHESIP